MTGTEEDTGADTGADPGAAETADGARRRWKQDPEAVRADILGAAEALFARKGYSGARVEEIAARFPGKSFHEVRAEYDRVMDAHKKLSLERQNVEARIHDVKDLVDLHERLRGELATLETRNRFARELHDSVKQQIFATSLQSRFSRTVTGMKLRRRFSSREMRRRSRSVMGIIFASLASDVGTSSACSATRRTR